MRLIIIFLLRCFSDFNKLYPTYWEMQSCWHKFQGESVKRHLLKVLLQQIPAQTSEQDLKRKLLVKHVVHSSVDILTQIDLPNYPSNNLTAIPFV